jgi:hypothetical protein
MSYTPRSAVEEAAELQRLASRMKVEEITPPVTEHWQRRTDNVSNPVSKIERKHSHYYRDVSKLAEIDVYRVCQLFGVNDPSGAIQHAIKKLLLPGQRGGKDTEKDLREAVDTLNRKLQMIREDAV